MSCKKYGKIEEMTGECLTLSSNAYIAGGFGYQSIHVRVYRSAYHADLDLQ